MDSLQTLDLCDAIESMDLLLSDDEIAEIAEWDDIWSEFDSIVQRSPYLSE